MVYPLNTEKFWLVGNEDSGFVVGSGDLEMTVALPKHVARLIAAAPDLLDALRRVMRHIPADAGGASLSDDMRRARKAIAHATSED